MLYQKKKIHFDRKTVTWCSFVFFVIWRVFLIVYYEGWYAFDETYHISSSNDDFYAVSLYRGGPYINRSIHFLSKVFGKSYYVYKSIPFVLSVLSIGLLTYVLYYYVSHTYSIIAFMSIICFHSVIIYNHLYIREYIWDEAVLSSLVFVFCRMHKANSNYRKTFLLISYVILASILAVLQSGYPIAMLIMGFAFLALILNIVLKKYLLYIRTQKITVLIAIIGICLIAIFVIILIAFRSGMIDLPLPESISSMLNVYGYKQYPYFTRNFYRGGIGLTIGCGVYGYSLIRKRVDYSNNIIGIYCLGVVPLIVFNLVWFDCFPMRVYASYLPIFVLIAILGFDLLPVRIPYLCFILGATVLVIMKPQSGIHLREYIRTPYIWRETNFNDYEGLVKETRMAIADGRKGICIWSNEHQEAAFEIDAEYTIAMENSRNESNGYTGEDWNRLLQYLQDTDEPYVLMIGTHCNWRIEAVNTDFFKILFEKYPYKKYVKDAYLFYINE